MAEPQRASLKDVINYQPQDYLKPDEVIFIRKTFKNNPTLMRLLRKLMLPTISDPELPIEQMGSDAFLIGREWPQIPADEAKILMVARQDAIQFILGGLIKLQVIANQKEPSPEEVAQARKLDSTK